MIKYKKNGFTLAEVLITLGIIGVVAALTIPTLVKNYQKTQYVTGLKKAYTTFNQALKQMSIENNCVDDLKCTGIFATGTSNPHNVLGTALVKYFNVAKDCKTGTDQGCMPATSNYSYDGSGTSDTTLDSTGAYKFITIDGTAYWITNSANDCDTPSYSTGRTGNVAQTCGQVIIDVNGLKPPNFEGRDIFRFFITNGKGAILYPWSGADDNYNWGSPADAWWKNSSGVITGCYSGSKGGWRCTGRVIEDGWQMNY